MAQRQASDISEIWVNYRFINPKMVEVVTEYGKVKRYGVREFLNKTIQAIEISEGRITDIDVNLLLTSATTLAISAGDIFCILNTSANDFISTLLIGGTFLSIARLRNLNYGKNEKDRYIRKFKLIDIRHIRGREMQLEAINTILENEEVSKEERNDLIKAASQIKEFLEIKENEKKNKHK